MNESLVSAEWLNQNQNSSRLIILDASPKTNVSGLKSGVGSQVIPGARFFDLKGKFSDPKSEFPNTLPSAEDFQNAAQELGINQNSDLVIYDNLGIYTSPRVWWMFRTMGHQKVHVLNGGLESWVQAGYKTDDTHQADFNPGNFKASFHKDSIRYLDDILQNIQSNSSKVIDARSVGRFTGTAPEPREGLSSGHIPHSCNLPFELVLDEGKYKSKEELIKIFNKLSPGDQHLTFTCGSGLTACIILLAAEQVLPNQMSVFDGSWTEWASNPQTPISK
ncbi:MAG: sulfurtransferase [Marinoscillum sp.]